MNNLKYVNIRHGTKSVPRYSNGNTLPLVQLPWGMAAFAVQTASDRGNWYFHPEDRSVEGIRLTHQPSPWIGDFGCFTLLPQSCSDNSFFSTTGGRWSGYRPEDAVFEPYYLKLNLLRYRTAFELSPTERGAAIRLKNYGNEQTRLSIYPRLGMTEYRVDIKNKRLYGKLHDTKRRAADNFSTYFVMEFSCNIDKEKCRLTSPDNNYVTALSGGGDTFGYSVALEGNEVLVNMAISYISEAQAEENLRREIGGKSFETVKSEAEKIWKQKLSKIQIETDNDVIRKTFYSCLYRFYLYPNKFHEIAADGQIIHFSPETGSVSKGFMYINNGFWDTYRTVYPLLSILEPQQFEEILDGFINIYDDTGWLPKWPSPTETGMMPGSLIDAVIAHAAATECCSAVLLERGLNAMLKHAENEPDERRHGRFGIELYKKYGYVPYEDVAESVNATLDYAYGDYCIGVVADKLGKKELAEKYFKRSGNYKNLFDKKSGFMRGRNRQGRLSPNFVSEAWGGEYCEGSAWQNSFSVTYDIDGMANLYGSKEAYIKKLDELFATPPIYTTGHYRNEIHEMTEMAAYDFGQCAISNQPSFHLPYLFAALGATQKTKQWVEKLVLEGFTDKDDGFPGDEDNGTMAAWYIFSCMGFYPLCPGKAEYIIGKQMVDSVTVNGKKISLKNIDKTYISHNELIQKEKRQ